MLEIGVAIGLLALFYGSALLGFAVKGWVPEAHRSKESLQLIQLVMSLIVTFTALVLGLLTTSVKASYDKAEHDRVQFAAEITQLDRCMRNYGLGSEVVRVQLQSYTAAVIASTWPSEPRPQGVDYPDPTKMARTGPNTILANLMNQVGLEIRKLDPPDPFHRKLAEDCFDAYKDALQDRWAVVEDIYSAMSIPFYCAVVFWLTMVFAGFGLSAPWNVTVGIVLLLGIVSVTSALVLIVDLDLPYEGIFSIPSTAMRIALAHMTEP